jgi:hypothetical protein
MNDEATKYRTADGPPDAGVTARLDAPEARLGDSDDIPETSDAAWSTAERGKHARPRVTAISVRLDAEVMA